MGEVATDGSALNRPEVVEEVRARFQAYEAALVTGDLGVLDSSFSSTAPVVRFGIADRQDGPDALHAWRAAQPPLPPGRRLFETVITTFGDDVAIVATHFCYPNRPTIGRQSQTWLRENGDWRIVHAHVSEIPSTESG